MNREYRLQCLSMTWLTVMGLMALLAVVFYGALKAVQAGREADDRHTERARVKAILDREAERNRHDAA